MQLAHTVEEAIDRFNLISGAGDGQETACVMSAVSWIAGEAWTDSPQCAHRLLRSFAIRADDADGTTAEMRAELLRAGATGLLDTWWVPDQVVLWAFSQADRDDTYFAQVLATVRSVGQWKDAKEKVDLYGADLSSADLRSANLYGADLYGADLSRTRASSYTTWPEKFDVAASGVLVAS